MVPDDLQELHKLHFESHNRYVYFLLGATGAALGYGLQKLDGLSLTWWTGCGILAILCWLASFYAGCKRISWAHRAMQANYDTLQLQRGIHPYQPADATALQDAIETRKNDALNNIQRAAFYLKMQFWLLATGLIAFVAWRILEMLRITSAP